MSTPTTITGTGPLQTFLIERSRLLALASRVVGDREAAEDVVQEVWVKWQRVDHAAVQNPAAFLTTATRRVAINVLQSAHHRNERPSQDPTDVIAAGADPAEHAERVAAIGEALGLLLARLRPAELAALLLRVCFGYPYDSLAGILGTEVPHARQLVRRARLALASDPARPVDQEQQRQLVTAFTRASEAGDLASLEVLLGQAARRSRRVTVIPAA